jgi:hypothetical protein
MSNCNRPCHFCANSRFGCRPSFEEYTVIGAEASKEISQTNQNTDNAIEIQMQTILEKVGGGMGTLVNTVNDMFSKLICKQEEMTNTTMQAFYEACIL